MFWRCKDNPVAAGYLQLVSERGNEMLSKRHFEMNLSISPSATAAAVTAAASELCIIEHAAVRPDSRRQVRVMQWVEELHSNQSVPFVNHLSMDPFSIINVEFMKSLTRLNGKNWIKANVKDFISPLKVISSNLRSYWSYWRTMMTFFFCLEGETKSQDDT